MKSKITLVILLLLIVCLCGTSVFFGYNYFNEKENVTNLTSQVESLKESYEEKEEETEPSQVIENIVETFKIPEFDGNKVEGRATSVEEQGRIINVGEASVAIGNRSTLGNKSQQVFRYRDNNYTFGENGGPNIIDAIYGTYNDGSSYYYAVLLEDGTVYYAKEQVNFEFKKVDLENAVRIIQLKVTDENGHIAGRLGVITDDGVTHIVEFE